MEGYRHIFTIPVRFRDLDARGHVNNAVFFTFFETARFAYLAEIRASLPPDISEHWNDIIAELTCQYKQPVFFGQQVSVGTRITHLGNTSFKMEHCLEADGQLAALGTAVLVHYDYAQNHSRPIPPAFREAVQAFESTINEA
jgi:acyl-CoA thioester hydrolase